MRYVIFVTMLTALALSSCAITSVIPTTTKINEPVVLGIKPSSLGPVSFHYSSGIKDGFIQTSMKDSRIPFSKNVSYAHTENTTLSKMLNEYASMKFAQLQGGADTKLNVTLKDFWIEQYTPEGSTSPGTAMMFGLDFTVVIAVHMDLNFEITKDGATTSKNVRVTTDNTQTVNMRSGQTIESMLAKAINDANNKAIVALNQFVEINQI